MGPCLSRVVLCRPEASSIVFAIPGLIAAAPAVLLQDALAQEISRFLDALYEDTNNTWVPCSNATVTTQGCSQEVAGGRWCYPPQSL